LEFFFPDFAERGVHGVEKFGNHWLKIKSFFLVHITHNRNICSKIVFETETLYFISRCSPHSDAYK